MIAGRCPSRPPQAGFLLLEVLVSILIFAIGVLALVGLQATAIRESSAAKYRADASLLANDLIGRMWGSDRTAAALQAAFNSKDGPAYADWLPSVAAALPGVTANPPSVQIAADCAPVVPCGAAVPSARVTINIFWKPPGAPTGDPAHNLTIMTRIK